jgi:hypothetical protein
MNPEYELWKFITKLHLSINYLIKISNRIPSKLPLKIIHWKIPKICIRSVYDQTIQGT